jgi:hypothetical protein
MTPSPPPYLTSHSRRNAIACSALVAILYVIGLGGCGRLYYLPGHNEDNYLAPPDVTMRVGERRKVLANGISMLAMTPVDLRSENPGIVAVEVPDQDDAFIRAVSVGSAHLYYFPSYDFPMRPDNKGFTVTVLPTKRRPKVK